MSGVAGIFQGVPLWRHDRVWGVGRESLCRGKGPVTSSACTEPVAFEGAGPGLLSHSKPWGFI